MNSRPAAFVAGREPSITTYLSSQQKKGRLKKIKDFINIDNTIILFESPYRLEKTLNQILDLLGNRTVVIGRELTKLYEEIIRGNLEDVIKYFSKSKVKGEIVIMIGKDDDRINF